MRRGRERFCFTSKLQVFADQTSTSGGMEGLVRSLWKETAFSAMRRQVWSFNVVKASQTSRSVRIFPIFTRVHITETYPGDRVAVEPGVPCGECFLCDNGRYNLCEDVQFAGVYPYHGTIQRYFSHPAKWCHKLPDNVSFAEGALLEPLSVVMHGIKSAGLSLGRGAVICGAGPIGLIALAAARASGAHPLVITDLEPKRLEFARSFVPSALTYQVDRNLDAEGNAKKIRGLFDFKNVGEYGAPEIVLECTGVESSVVTAAYTARRGGTVMVIGVGKQVMNNLPFMHLALGEVSKMSTISKSSC